MGRRKGSKNRPKDVVDAEKAAPKAKKSKGAGPVTVTSMRSKPAEDPRMPETPAANGPSDLARGEAPVRIPVENGRTYMKDLAVPVEEHEVALAAADMVREIRKREAVLEQRREAMAEFKETLVGIDKRMQDLATTVENHTKTAPVKVTERLIVETSTIEVVRLDTGEIVETRAAEADDVQAGMFPPAVMAPVPAAPPTSPGGDDEDSIPIGDDEDEEDAEAAAAEGSFDPSAKLPAEPEVDLDPETAITSPTALLDAHRVAEEALAEEDGA